MVSEIIVRIIVYMEVIVLMFHVCCSFYIRRILHTLRPELYLKSEDRARIGFWKKLKRLLLGIWFSIEEFT